MKSLTLLALLAFAATAGAETPPAPAQDPAPSKPRPPLKLNLDDAAPARPTITFGKPEEKKKDPAKDLPGLGGPPSGVWVEPAKPVYPQNTGGAETVPK
jgi:hypothetical protein